MLRVLLDELTILTIVEIRRRSNGIRRLRVEIRVGHAVSDAAGSSSHDRPANQYKAASLDADSSPTEVVRK